MHRKDSKLVFTSSGCLFFVFLFCFFFQPKLQKDTFCSSVGRLRLCFSSSSCVCERLPEAAAAAASRMMKGSGVQAL